MLGAGCVFVGAVCVKVGRGCDNLGAGCYGDTTCPGSDILICWGKKTNKNKNKKKQKPHRQSLFLSSTGILCVSTKTFYIGVQMVNVGAKTGQS